MRFDVTRHLVNFSIRPSAPPCSSSRFVSCAFWKPLLNFWARSFCVTLVVSFPEPSGRAQQGS